MARQRIGPLLVAGAATAGVVVGPLLRVLGRLGDHIGVGALSRLDACVSNVAGA